MGIVKHQTYTVELDVAADSKDAINAVRDVLAPTARRPQLVSESGPAGCPVVSVTLQAVPMLRFLLEWHQEKHVSEFIIESTNPNLPARFLGESVDTLPKIAQLVSMAKWAAAR